MRRRGRDSRRDGRDIMMHFCLCATCHSEIPWSLRRGVGQCPGCGQHTFGQVAEWRRDRERVARRARHEADVVFWIILAVVGLSLASSWWL